MAIWLPIQTALALGAWSYAVHTVIRVHTLGYWGGRGFVRAIARRGDRSGLDAVHTLSQRLGGTVLGTALSESNGELVALEANGHGELALLGDGDRALRGIATVSTTLGLLAAIATLRSAVAAEGMDFQSLAGQAMDSAVLGFVTGLPCWTAVALCRGRLRAARAELDQTLAALQDGGVDAEGGGEVVS